jgi:DNA-directed RNA polymerase subunit H (RpoH/RPB5)
MKSRLLFLALGTSALAADPNPKADDIAGNEAVKKIMETRPGRGVMRDDTPPTAPQDAVKQFKTRSDVAIDLMAHELVPKMRVITDAEKRELLARYKMRITQMPRMLAKDPCARYLSLTRGTVVCITRQPPDAEAYATYRVVV